MDDHGMTLLKRILETPSPSGYEQPVQEIVRAYVADFADEVRTDLHGNVIAVQESRGAAARDVRRPLRPDRPARAAHRRRRLHLRPDRSAAGTRSMLIGQRMTVWTASGPCPASSPASRSTCSTDEERKQVRQAQGPVARHRREGQGRSRRSWCAIGDPVTLRARLPGRCATTWPTRPAMDDKIGPVGRASKRCAAQQREKLERRAVSPSRPCRKRSACAARRPAPTASIRTSASPST